jgi:TolB protein
MTDREVQRILRKIGGGAEPRPGFKQELGELLAAELEDEDPDAKGILRLIDGPAAPRQGFKAELGAMLAAQLEEGERVVPPAGSAARQRGRPGGPVMSRLKSGWWMQSAAAVIVLAIIASGFAWNSCLQGGEVADQQLAGPASPGEVVEPASPGEAPAEEGGAGPDGTGMGSAGGQAPSGGTPGGGGTAPGGAPAPGSDVPTAPADQPPAEQPKPDEPPSVTSPGPSAEPPGVLAFVSRTSDGYWHVFTMLEDGKHRVQLTEGPHYDRAPEWSPDGRRLAFMRVEKEDEHKGKIFIVNADGSGLQFLVDGGEPSWSPDGTQVVYWAGDPSRLYVINIDGSGNRELPLTALGLGDPHWSPRGNRIAFAGAATVVPPDDPTQHPNKVTQVYTVRPDGSQVRRLTDFTWACNMAFSPDGKRIAFTMSSDFLSTNVWTMNRDGTDKRQLTSGTGIRAYPHWSPDGKRVVFALDPDADAHWSFAKAAVGPAPSAIWIMNDDGSDQQRISPPGVDDADPVFRPAARRNADHSQDG